MNGRTKSPPKERPRLTPTQSMGNWCACTILEVIWRRRVPSNGIVPLAFMTGLTPSWHWNRHHSRSWFGRTTLSRALDLQGETVQTKGRILKATMLMITFITTLWFSLILDKTQEATSEKTFYLQQVSVGHDCSLLKMHECLLIIRFKSRVAV